MAQISVEDLPPDANLGVLSFLDARCMAVAQLSCQAFRVLTPAAARAREALHTSLYLKQRQQVAEQAAATEEEAALPDYLTLVRRKSQAAYSLAAPSSARRCAPPSKRGARSEQLDSTRDGMFPRQVSERRARAGACRRGRCGLRLRL